MVTRKRKVETIGSVELVTLPEQELKNIPAKIDTGADYSSIWASNISIDRNVLSFSLFGQGSRFYNGERISTREFQTSSIKNSFGVTEIRYKVKLLVVIGDRKIRAWISLSDRSTMSYPMLLGRQFLRSKFLVDVSKAKVHSKQKSRRVLVMGSNTGEELAKFMEGIQLSMKNDNTRFVVRSYSDLAFIIEKRNKVKVVETKTMKDIGKFDMVYFKSHKKNPDIAAAAAQYLKFSNVKFFDKELITSISYDKLSDYIRMSLYGLPVPMTLCGSPEYLKENSKQIVKKSGWPIVCKEIRQDRGKQNYLVPNQRALVKIFSSASSSDSYLLQEYVPNNGYLRMYIFGSEVGLAIKRRAAKDHKNPLKQHLNNPRGSANAEIVDKTEIKPLVTDLAIRAAKLMNRQIAGVDLIQNRKNKSWFILEVNKAPQLRSGSYLKEKKEALAKFIDFELNR